MAKNKKAQKPHRHKTAADLSLLPRQTVLAQAREKLQEGNYSRAIEMYRHLVQQDPDDAFGVAELAQAYRGRIRELAHKGMDKEALAICDNMVTFCGDEAAPVALPIQLLLNAGFAGKAAEKFRDSAELLDRGTKEQLERLFAARVLSGESELLRYFPADCALALHYQIIQEVLEAYAGRADERAAELLRQLPFSSPFKEFRLIVRGMIELAAQRRSEATALFAKVAEASPFLELARCCLTACNTEQPARLLTGLKGTALTFTAQLRGLEPAAVTQLTNLERAAENPDRLFQFCSALTGQLGVELTRRICLRLLPFIPKRRKNFEKQFGAFTPFESLHQQALAWEQQKEYPQAVESWLQAAGKLDTTDPTTHLPAATIRRHVVQLLEKHAPPELYENVGTVQLQKSLALDATDKESYLKLYQLLKASKEKNQLLEQALKELPDDVDVLLLAIETAIERQAFKKASQLTARLLKIDPINTKARSLLISAHLNHGKKLTKSGKFALARKEFLAASSADRTGLSGGRCHLFLALLTILEGNSPGAEQWFAEGGKLAGSAAASLFAQATLIELLRLPHPVLTATLTKNIKELNTISPSKQDLFLIMKQVNGLEKSWQPVGLKIFAQLTKFSTKIFKLSYSKEEYLAIGKFFHTHAQYQELKKLAVKAEKIYPGTPRLVYYRLYGQSRGGQGRLSYAELEELEQIEEQAHELHDTELERQVDELLLACEMFSFPRLPSRLQEMLSGFLDIDDDY